MKKLLPALATGALFAAGADAQVTYFGAGCAGGSGLTPSISISGFPEVTSSFSVDISTGIPSTLTILVIGGSNTTWLGSPLPLDLGFVGLGGCDLNVSYDNTLTFIADAAGDVSLPVSGAGFAPGTTVYTQVFALDPSPTTLGGMSDGMEVVIGAGQGGPLVITEFMKDSGFISDTFGEYVEIYNPTGADIDIEGYTLADLDFDATVLDNGGLGIIVPAGGFAVLGREDDPALNGNITVAYEYNQNGQFFLSNSSDEIVLYDGGGNLVDRVVYDNGVIWPDTSGASIEVDMAFADVAGNDDGTKWAHSTCTIAGGPTCNPDLGTPGSSNASCSTTPCGGTGGPTGDLIFSEIMQNPSAVSDGDGEWFEVYNTTGADIDMLGYTIQAGGSPSIEVISTSVVVPAGGYALFARKSDPLVNGGLPTPAYDYDDGLNFGNSSQTVKILDGAGGTVFEMTYDNGATYPDPNGASMTLDPTKLNATDAAIGTNWCTGSTPYGLGDLGTPGAGNDTCP